MVTIERMQEMLDEVCTQLPAQFFNYLNGGICLMDETRPDPRAQGLYILGEYHRGGPLGRYISIYYGSIARAYGFMDEKGLQEEVKSVLLHEFTHHLESLAGEKGLEIKDRQFLEAYKEKLPPPSSPPA